MHPDLDRICPLPPDPSRPPRVIGRATALACGYTRGAIEHRLAAGQWLRVLPRTYFTADIFTEHDRTAAALTFAGSGAVLSGAAALRSSGVRRVGAPKHVLVLVPDNNRTRSGGFVVVQRSQRPIVREQWTGPPRVEVARATADLARSMRQLDDVRTLVARVVQDGHCTLAELGAELAAGRRNGSARLRQALAEVGWGAASAPEAEAARILRRGGIRGFEQNATLTLPDETMRVVDFYWPRLRACLEIDSVEWHFGVDERTGTWDRHLDLTKYGYSVIHRPPSALSAPARFCRDVAEWLAGREAELRRGLR